QHFGQQHTIGKLRLSATRAARPVRGDGVPDTIAKIAALPVEKRGDQQKAEIAKYYRSIDPRLAELDKQLAEATKPEKLPAITKAQTLSLGATRATKVLIRGDFLRPGAEVSAAVPGVLPPLPAV